MSATRYPDGRLLPLTAGLEVDVVIHARVRVLEVLDDEVRLEFEGAARPGLPRTVWVHGCKITEGRPVQASIDLYVSELECIRNLMGRCAEPSRTSTENRILRVIDEAIGRKP